MKKILIVLAVLTMLILAGCTDAEVASRNLSKSADMFRVVRRIVFYNGITGDYILSIEGLCSLGNTGGVNELTVTCKVGDTDFKKHFLGLSDNVTYFAEQIEPVSTDVYHYKVIFKPSVIIPDIDIP
jgi:hypothetical protein